MQSLPQDLCARIINLDTIKKRDLLSLCLTCKSLQRVAEARLYNHMSLTDTHRALQGCFSLIENERLAQHVVAIFLNPDERRPGLASGEDFWLVVQRALIACNNLKTLLIADPTFVNGWVMNSPFPFQLREAKLRFVLDEHIVQFLESQPSLKVLHMYDYTEDEVDVRLRPGALPELQVFDGMLSLGVQFTTRKLTHVQVIVDMDPVYGLTAMLRHLAQCKDVKSINMLDIPYDATLEVLALIPPCVPNILHIGLLPYPIRDRHEFHQHLMALHYLEAIELDMGKWHPLPIPLPAQRAIASEINLFCPSLHTVILWMGNMHVQWSRIDGKWLSQVSANTYPQTSSFWCYI
ncbi:hypothetical protein CPC08DRAFT_690798 [Agrocybe pediades]|nr:hypothetical protein CPC08DRAFT_690798 [Agrocybe pediades]